MARAAGTPMKARRGTRAQDVRPQASPVPVAPARPPCRALRAMAAVAIALALMALPAAAHAQDDTAFTRALQLGPVLGPIVAGIVAFGFGVATCATPCVYPMITITVSIFGAREAKSR